MVEKEIKQLDGAEDLLFLRDKSETPKEYCHLKIYHKTATKEYMMRRMLEDMENAKNTKIVAFGTNKNDLSMMAAADMSYATAEAIPEAKAIAD